LALSRLLQSSLLVALATLAVRAGPKPAAPALQVVDAASVRVCQPVWLRSVDLPSGGLDVELRRGRKKLKALPGGRPRGMATDLPKGRYPLHLMFRLDQPGGYRVRVTARDERGKVRSRTPWVGLSLAERQGEAERSAWLARQSAKIRTADVQDLLGEILPSLLACPDEVSLNALLPALQHPAPPVRTYATRALRHFDATLVHDSVLDDILKEMQADVFRNQK